MKELEAMEDGRSWALVDFQEIFQEGVGFEAIYLFPGDQF
jgi:hypothetical protein